MRISSKKRRLILYVIIFSSILDLIDLIVQWNHSSSRQPSIHHYNQTWCHSNSSFYLNCHQTSHQHAHHQHHYHRLSLFGGVSGLVLNYNIGNPSDSDDPVRPSPHHSSSDSWVSEELWPKEKSIIHIKLIKPVPKELAIRESRNKDTYLMDPSLDFDSPYRSLSINNCIISFKSYYDGFTSEPNNQEITRDTSNIQVQISGGTNCKELPLSPLTAFSANLTHLVVKDTGITNLTKFLFGANRLDKLIRLDIIGNRQLTHLQPRAFDGLTRLSYLSLINNHHLIVIALESFAGLKSLEELIFLGNGQSWDQDYFTSILRATSDKILPNLIHLHLNGAQIVNNQNDNDETNLYNQVNNNQERTSISVTSSNNQKSAKSDHEDDPNDEAIKMSESLSQSSQASGEITVKPKSGRMANHQRKSGLKINKNDFEGLTQVKYLQLSDCDITYIHPYALTPLLKNLISLNLAGNPKLRINNLKSTLRVFYVSNMKKLNVESGDQPMVNTTFPNYQLSSQSKNGLVMLDLSNSIDTSYVPKDLLTVISKTTITELYMASVPWRSLKEGDIPPLPNLKVLHIDYNQIETIDEKTFDGLEDLIKLSLRGNLIRKIPLYLLEPLRKLEYLDLSGYQVKLPLSTISNNYNENRHHHQDHAVSDNGDNNNNDDEKLTNQLSKKLINQYTPLNIPRKFFVGTSLKELNLSYKNLTQLTRFQFIGLYKLERLHLRGCNLQNIEYLTFFPLKSIVYIDLSENNQLIGNVRSSEEDTFAGLEAIEMIRLANCNLTTEDINDFNIWRRMHEHVQLLDLSSNLINLINSTTLANFTELRHINLSHNRIQSWHNYTIFGKNSFITTLDISHNQITHLTAEMLGDFRNLKNLSFAFNPLHCECDWDGPLLLLDQKQKQLNQASHAKIKDHIWLVHRQQEIVSTAFSSSQAPPKSIIEWLNTTSIHFLLDHHPLRSDRHYFCHQTKSPLEPPIVFKKFFYQDCPVLTSSRANARVSVGILMVTVCTALLLAVFFLVIAFIYNTTIRNLLIMVDDDFLHNYQYDAFVSYNVNDSDWVFNILVPALEDLPTDEHCENGQSTIKFNNNNDNNNNQSSSESSVTSSSSSSSTNQHPSPAKSNVKLCVYDRDFIAGRPISECITESIRNSRKVILIISNNFAQSPWCRFETDLAHNTLMDQNREGLILIKLEEMSSEVLEKVSPQLHFLLKTRIYLTWSESPHEQEIFWKKLRRALGFNKSYGTVRQYYKNYVGGLTKDYRQSTNEFNIRTSINHIESKDANKEEVNVSFTRKTLSTSRDSLPSHDSGITVIDDSGCVSVNGDESGDNPLEFIVDQREMIMDGNGENKQNNLDKETAQQSSERKVTSVAIQLLNVIGNNSEEEETIDREEIESVKLKEKQFVSLEMDTNYQHTNKHPQTDQ